MTTSAELELTTVTVAPGNEAFTTLTVRNDSDIVEAYDLTVQGPCAPWSTVEPSRLSLYPGTSETVTVWLRPPRTPDVLAGEVPLGVRVLPAERPELVVVPETTVRLLPFGDLDVRLRPRRRRAWWQARFQVELANVGNVPVTLQPHAADPAEELRFRITPARVRLDPGTDTDLRLRARLPKLIWFGRPMSRTFLLTAGPEPDAPTLPGVELSQVDEQFTGEADGEVVQLPLLPKWLLALLALLIALVLLWFTLVRPAVQSAAKQAAQDSTNEAVKSGKIAPGPAAGGAAPSQQAPPAAGGAQPGGGSGGGAAGGGGGGGGGGATARGGQQASQTITVNTPGGAGRVNGYVVPRGKVFLITDLVLANYQGDNGLLTVFFGKRELTTIALETFRNQDYHWVTPIEVPAGQSVRAAVVCRRPGAPAGEARASRCAEVMNVSGALRNR